MNTIADITQPELAQALQRALDNKTKPLGSLGRLEALAQRIGLILGTLQPELREPQMLVCAADHGLAARGVSADPSDVTWQMVENFLAGGAAVSVLARQHGIGLNVVDCGVRHEFAPRPGLFEDPRVLHALFGAAAPTLDTVFDGLADFLATHVEPGLLDQLIAP